MARTSKGNGRLTEKLLTLLIVPFVLVILIVHVMFNIACLRYTESQRLIQLGDGTISKVRFYAMQNQQTHDIVSNDKSSKVDEVVINVIKNKKGTTVHKKTRKYPKRKKGHDFEAWRNDISNEDWFKYYKPNKNVSNNHDFKFILNNLHLCKGDIKLVIIVHSHPSRRKRRDAIRDTWGKFAFRKQLNQSVSGEVRVVFLLGFSEKKAQNERVRKESEHHGDIVQEDFKDKYRNLTLKTIMGLRWVSNFCSKARFLLKTDDDVFVHVPRLLHYIRDKDTEADYDRVMYGRINYPVNAERSGKWEVSIQSFPFKIYPIYASGGGYLLPASMCGALFNVSKYFPQFPLEDVAVTGILRMALGYHLHQFPALIEDRYIQHSAECDIARIPRYVLVHSVKPSRMFSIQKVLAQNGTGCPLSVKGFKKIRRARRRDLPLKS